MSETSGSEVKINRRGFLRRAAGVTAAVLAGSFFGAGKPGAAVAPEAPRTQDAPVQSHRVATELPVREAVPAGGRSEANDHANWGLSMKEDKVIEPPDEMAALNMNMGLSEAQVLNLPGDDLMKEHIQTENLKADKRG